jgi:hypothetical protein
MPIPRWATAGAALLFVLLALGWVVNAPAAAQPAPAPADRPPSGCSLCNLTVSNVTISCNSNGSVHWSATVTNSGNCTVNDGWSAQLQAHRSGMSSGQFQTVATQTGSAQDFPPGTTIVSGDFCYAPGSNVNSIRVAFAPTPVAGFSCRPQGKSAGIAPCPACFTPTPTPSNTPTNTPTDTAVVPTHTPTNTPTNTAVVPTHTPTNTPTNTAVVPTHTPTNTPTNTAVVPTATATNTQVACIPNQTFTGAITAGDPSHQNFVNFAGGGPSVCGAAPMCPGVITDSSSYHYDTYTFTNTTGSAQCITVTVNATGCGSGSFGLASYAYLGTFDPNNLCANYAGSSNTNIAPTGPGTYHFTVPAGQTFTVEVEEYVPSSLCPSYTVTIGSCAP